MPLKQEPPQPKHCEREEFGHAEPRHADHRDLRRFLFGAVSLTCVLLAVFWHLPWIRDGLCVLCSRVSAIVVSRVINVFGGNTSAVGLQIESEIFPMRVVPECLAIEPTALFVACVLCFPTTWSKKLWALVVGLPLLHAANLARMVALYFVGTTYADRWHVAHIHISQTAITVLVVVIWLIWMRWAGRNGTSRGTR